MKILLVEDDKRLAQNLKTNLKKEGFAVDLARNRDQAQVNLEVNQYDVVVLDLNLPDSSGLTLLTWLRNKKNQVPVIIVTAAGDLTSKLEGLNLGADDYLIKPVNFQELVARIYAVVRRSKANPLPTIKVGKLTIKPAQHYVAVDSNELELTAKEFAVLEYLAIHHNQVVTRSMLMEHVWGSDFESFSNVIDVYIKNLRKKLKPYGCDRSIQTIRGKGYVLREDQKPTDTVSAQNA